MVKKNVDELQLVFFAAPRKYVRKGKDKLYLLVYLYIKRVILASVYHFYEAMREMKDVHFKKCISI